MRSVRRECRCSRGVGGPGDAGHVHGPEPRAAVLLQHAHLRLYSLLWGRCREAGGEWRVWAGGEVPSGSRLVEVVGEVRDLLTGSDPEFAWLDRIRSPRATNEARLLLLKGLAAQLSRRIGRKALSLHANAVIGFALSGLSTSTAICIHTRQVPNERGYRGREQRAGRPAGLRHSRRPPLSRRPHSAPSPAIPPTPDTRQTAPQLR